MGVHKRHFAEPGDKSRPDQMGGPDRGRVPLPQVGGRGAAMGQEEEQQQHDLRETQSGHEVGRQTTVNYLHEKSLNLFACPILCANQTHDSFFFFKDILFSSIAAVHAEVSTL